MKSDTFPTLQAKHHRRVIIHHFSPKKKAQAFQTCLYICSLNPPQVCTWPCTSAPCCLAVSAWSMPASRDEIGKVGYGKLEMIEWILGFLHHLLTNPVFFSTIWRFQTQHRTIFLLQLPKSGNQNQLKTQRNFPPTCAAGGIGCGKIGPSTLAYVFGDPASGNHPLNGYVSQGAI